MTFFFGKGHIWSAYECLCSCNLESSILGNIWNHSDTCQHVFMKSFPISNNSVQSCCGLKVISKSNPADSFTRNKNITGVWTVTDPFNQQKHWLKIILIYCFITVKINKYWFTITWLCDVVCWKCLNYGRREAKQCSFLIFFNLYLSMK